MARCVICHDISPFIAAELAVCLACLRTRSKEALEVARRAHAASRARFGLPALPPCDPTGAACHLCINECRIPEHGTGYCGLRKNEGARLVGVSATRGKLSWYHDPLPTNCVADWVCAGGTGAGFPAYAHCPGPERGYRNLAVFFHACSFNCLFCQNWQFRSLTGNAGTSSVANLMSAVDDSTSCICYFGGDPTPQLPFALAASRRALERRRGRILRLCWETNGSMHAELLDEMLEYALQSGGCVKFDLKAWDDTLHRALTGVSNARTLTNFERADAMSRRRPVPPLVIASTLLVPGYIDVSEVKNIARFIASINHDIPYSLLAFHPHFCMADLPRFSRNLAYRCLQAARLEGLAHVRLGNVHLLV